MAAPTGTDWSYADASPDDTAQADLNIALPEAAEGWQLYGAVNAGAFAFADQALAPGKLFYDAPGVSSGDTIKGKVRWIISGAGFGDPDSVYSDFSLEKSFIAP